MTRALVQTEAIGRLKSAGSGTLLPVQDGAGKQIASLVPISIGMAEDVGLLTDLCRWRSANMESFLTVFEPSIEKTQSYLRKFSLPDPARILFVIQDISGTRVGNIGLCNIAPDSAELDNVIRGEQVGVRYFMRWVQWSLIEWAFDNLGVERVYLNVLGDNSRAIASYRGAGFEVVERSALKREDIPGGYRLVLCPTAEGSATLVRMEISAGAFRRVRASLC